MDVMSELQKIGPLYTAGECDAGLRAIRQLWQDIPEPKTEISNAYLVLEYGVGFSLKKGDVDEARRWAELAPPFAEARHDMGEVEFLMGRVAFEGGDFDLARKHFAVANIKSEGRVFEGKDAKYKRLIR